MAPYIFICLGLSFLVVWRAGDPALMILFPAFVGYYLGVGRKNRAAGLVAMIVLAGYLASDYSFSLALAYGVAAASGTFFARGWTLGRAVSAVSAVLCVLMLGIIAAFSQETLDNVLNEINALAARTSGAGEEIDREAMTKATKELAEALPFWGLGMVCGMIALGVTFCGAVLAKRLRAVGVTEKLTGRFREARTPEWLVWLAIGLALACIIEDRWPNSALRMLTWNSALGLACVYWINGFGILLYGLKTFQVTGFWYYLPLVLMFMPQFGAPILLTSLGFFDTWWELRRRMDLVAARRKDQDNENS